MRLLTNPGNLPSGWPAVSRIYLQSLQEALIALWGALDRICGKRVKASLAPTARVHGTPWASTTERECVYASADDQCSYHRPDASHCARKGLWQKEEENCCEPPRAQAGCGAHVCRLGRSQARISGDAFGWTECIALPVCKQSLIVEVITGLRSRLPFPLLGLDIDNASVFLNETRLRYRQQQGIAFTRSRACQKNDQEWVEQKNGSIVRKLIGYGRQLATNYGFIHTFGEVISNGMALLQKTSLDAGVRDVP
jgi:hypothetical protein